MRMPIWKIIILGLMVVAAIAVGGTTIYLWATLLEPLPTAVAVVGDTTRSVSTIELPSAWTPTLPPSPTVTPTLWSSTTMTLPNYQVSYDDVLERIGYLLGPYLQNVTTNSVIVAWETGGTSQGAVVFGETEEYRSTVIEQETGTRHHVTLTGLKPYTIYHYRLLIDGIAFSEDLTFRSAAGPDHTTFNFVVYGDTHFDNNHHQSIVNRAIALEPDFGLHVGDLVNNGLEPTQWDAFFEVERDLLAKIPLYPTLGNHEVSSEQYFDRFYLPGNEHWYSFDYGNARFICLQVDGMTDITVNSDQYRLLEKELTHNPKPWTFVFFHKSPFTSEYEGSREQHIRSSLTPLFEQYGVDIVFNGHNHNYQRSNVNDVIYIVTGGGGGVLSESIEPDEHLLVSRSVYHLVHITIDGNTLTGKAMTPDGEVFDHFNLSLP